jgi:hypothetical protein
MVSFTLIEFYSYLNNICIKNKSLSTFKIYHNNISYSRKLFEHSNYNVFLILLFS